MKLHSIQQAYFKPFVTDAKTGKLWVYPKNGDRKFLKPSSWCTAEDAFQPRVLEHEQNAIVEAPGIIALRKLSSPSVLSAEEYHRISQWAALHTIRNKKMRRELGEAYQEQFRDEFEKELLFTKAQYPVAYTYRATKQRFFITSDNPVVEVKIPNGPQLRLLVITPRMLAVFAPCVGKFTPDDHSVEDYVNSVVWAFSFEYVYSHKSDVDIERFKQVAVEYKMIPVFESQQFLIAGCCQIPPSKFSNFNRRG